MKAVIEKNDISNKNIDPKMTLILSASTTFKQKLFILSTKKVYQKVRMDTFLDLHRELRNVSFFFSLSDFSLKIVVQLMVICKKNSFTQFCIQFCFTINLHNGIHCPLLLWKQSTQRYMKLIAQSSPKLNEIDGKTSVDQRSLLAWHDTIMIPYAFQTLL